jgi:dienelactone hydrolase
MISKFSLLAGLLVLKLLLLPVLAADPTGVREWTAKGGFKVQAKALQVSDGKVQLERADGTKLAVDLAKFTDEDQAALRDHFGAAADAGGGPAAAAGDPATDLPHPLGQPTGELTCGAFHYFLYLPNSLRQGEKHPVVFVMSPGGGNAGTIGSYRPGAERNGWIIAVSNESKNGFDGSEAAIDAMMAEVRKTLPIDEKRMYVSGFSGGARMAYLVSGSHKEIAGVIPCGAGGSLGSSKQVAYGLCGTNCFNRGDMARSFKGVRSKDSVLRYFPGMHVWAGPELLDDAITHLNGVFLIENRRDHAAKLARYIQGVTDLIDEAKDNNPTRAFMWTSFLNDRKVIPSSLSTIHNSLAATPANVLYLKGLTGVREFAEKEFGGGGSAWKIDPKVAAACEREAKKYEGTAWLEILEKMAEDAEKF